MKKTFRFLCLDWIILSSAVIEIVSNYTEIIAGSEFFNIYLLNITCMLASALAIISLVTKRLDGERFSRLYILIVVISPGLFTIGRFFYDWEIYSYYHDEIITNPQLYIGLGFGISLLICTFLFSRKSQTENLKDFGHYIIIAGIFTLLYNLSGIHDTEPELFSTTSTVIRSLISLSIIFTGYLQTKNRVKLLPAGLIAMLLLTAFCIL